jgi:hypothetical protein
VFERASGNAHNAIERHKVDYPVAQGNLYATWTAWGNKYWPAVYLLDRSGHIVFSHVGAGDCEHIEQQIHKAVIDQAP